MNKLTNQQQNGFSTKQNNGNNNHHVQFVFDDVDRLHLPTNLYMPKNDVIKYLFEKQILVKEFGVFWIFLLI